MSEEEILELARKIGNEELEIKDKCPRYCKNPGLFFGAVLALRTAVKPERDINEIIEWRKQQFEELKSKKK